MVDPCSFSKPNECRCTHISWFVNVLFEKQILDCRAELDFEVKENGVKKLVRRITRRRELDSPLSVQREDEIFRF